MTTPKTITFELRKLSDFQVEPNYNSVRKPGDVQDFAKEVASQMEASGDNQAAFPIRYISAPDGNLYVRNHSTFAAAELRDWKTAYFREITEYAHGTAEDKLDLVNSNNGGHPVGAYEQGELYASLIVGITEPYEEDGEIKHREIIAPMTRKEIAEKRGISEERVRQCEAIFELPEEIAGLIEAEQISADLGRKAMQLAKQDAKKALRICKAAIENAKTDGKDKATRKHFDAIKDDFKPDMIADNGKTPKTKAGKSGGESTNTGSAEPDGDKEPEAPTGGSEPIQPAGELLDMTFTTKATLGDRREILKAFFMDSDNTENVPLEEVTVEGFLDKIESLYGVQSPI